MKNLWTKRNIGWGIFTLAIFMVFQGLFLADLIKPVYQIMLMTIGINIILALGLNLIIGFSGQFSLGHAGFMAIGAYCAAITTTQNPNFVGLLMGIGLGIILSSIVALIVAIPTLRLRGDYLAIATLGFSEIIRIVILNMKITGGASGISGIPKLTSFNLVFIVIVGCLLIIHNFVRSSHGRACISVREDEIASEAMGVNTTKYKTIAFVIGAAMAAVAGALYASYFYVIKPDVFGFQKSVDILVVVVLGGMGSLTGSVVAAFVLGIITQALQSMAELRMIIYAIALIIIMIYRPQGIFGNKEFSIDSIKQFWYKITHLKAPHKSKEELK
ncbi:MAG: branched-chain amino acid ABC transporter permease [Erysipelotrichaceae bacterium]